MAKENVDTPEEIEWGRSMSETRNVFLQKLVKTIDREKKAKAASSASKGLILCQALIRFQLTIYSVAEPVSGRLRPLRSQQEGARDKPYIHYLPPDGAPQLTRSGIPYLCFWVLRSHIPAVSADNRLSYSSSNVPHRNMLQRRSPAAFHAR